MELNKAVPVIRAAARQVNVSNILTKPVMYQANAAGGYRLQHTGRQERIRSGDDKKFQGDDVDVGGRFDQRTMTETLKDKANQAMESVKNTAHNLKESIKEKTGMADSTTTGGVGGNVQNEPRIRDPQKEPLSEIYETQGREYEKKYEDSQGTNRMGAEGNLWEANQHGAKESTASRPGYNKATDQSTFEKVGDMIKGATHTVTETVSKTARNLGLKK